MNGKKNVALIMIALYGNIMMFAQVSGRQIGIGTETAVPQAEVPIESIAVDANNLQLAISSRNYPVTPGDVYIISFIMAGTPIQNTLLVESDYIINLDVLGKINAKNMTFPTLKPIIEKIIADAYPRSMPSLTIQRIGTFQVRIIGAINRTQYPLAWGLSRLSEILDPFLREHSSIRDVVIRSVDETETTYDLLKAQVLGDTDQDPYLKPDDLIIISANRKTVEVTGEVIRPGNYQLLSTESSKELFHYFGGFTTIGDADRIRISRRNSNDVATVFVSLDGFLSGVDLYDGDTVTVNKQNVNQPIVYFEGAIREENGRRDILNAATADEETMSEVYTRIMVPIGIGDTLFDLLSIYEDYLLDNADLTNGYIIRVNQNEPLRVNMERLLYDNHWEENVELKSFDRVIIPQQNFYVSVVGAVSDPGIFPYSPSRTALAYASLAGGIDTERNSNQAIEVIDKNGNERSAKEPIQAGDTVNVLPNNFWYNFGERFGPITTAALFITSAVSIITLLNTGE